MPDPCTGNLFDNLPADLPEEQFHLLCQLGHVRIERIVSRGHTSPAEGWYDQPQDEWVVLLRGHARIHFADSGEQTLAPGDWLLIPAHRQHRVTWTSSEELCVWLAIHA